MSLFDNFKAKFAGKPKRPPKMSPAKVQVRNTAPKPTPDYEPIPLSGDEPDIASEETAAKESRAAGRELPVYIKLVAYFDEFRGTEIPKNNADDLVEWYREYRRIHAGARLSSAALFGMARLLVNRKENDLALDAYDRLLGVIAEEKRGLAALEAARFAEFTGDLPQAVVFVRKALEDPLLPADRCALAQNLMMRVTK